ncbi:MAG TPA: right-handed parallel beta-helix repeat-containing protein [Actinomycetes bacterium]|nr:right-handed parallel beta-helix repeat-containing protein [Actinomycetes bacterium]
MVGRPRRGARRGWWLLPLAMLLPAGCGDRDAQPRTVPLRMGDNFFAKELLRVPAGASVEFENRGRSVHNAVEVGGAWRTRQAIASGDAQTVTFTRPGVYRFLCTFHATRVGGDLRGMVGTLVVGDGTPYDASVYGRGRALPVTARPSGTVRRVPGRYRTIQAAVDASGPGDLVLIGPGVYREEVKVTVPSLVIRGSDRNRVIIDGQFQRPNGIAVTADGVAVENLTVRNSLLNGVFWTGVRGYRASYVTAVNNADYGVYAFDSVDGLFERSYASGSPDSGFYIGQCNPCRAVVDGVTAERNAIGYSGTNASGDLHIVRSTWRRNLSGIVPNTLDTELKPPVHDVDVVGNVVADNGNRAVPVLEDEWSTYGSGIILAGGEDIRVERNLVLDNPRVGILVTLNVDQNVWLSSGNLVRGNLVRGSGRADLALSGPAGPGNCFSGNDVRSTLPPALQLAQACDGPRLPWRMDLSTTADSLGLLVEAGTGGVPGNRVQDVPPPAPQPQLPGGAGAPVRPAVGVYAQARPDLDRIARPPLPAGTAIDAKEPSVFAVPLAATSPWQVVLSLYGYLLPVVLLAAWVSLAFWDLAARSGELRRGVVLGWVAAVLLLPLVGVLAYHVLGRPRLPVWLRAAVIGGGIATWLIVLGVGAALGGIV